VLNTDDGSPSVTESVRRTFCGVPNLFHVRYWKSYTSMLEKDSHQKMERPIHVGEAALSPVGADPGLGSMGG
jgi:hypothetical protein